MVVGVIGMAFKVQNIISTGFNDFSALMNPGEGKTVYLDTYI